MGSKSKSNRGTAKKNLNADKLQQELLRLALDPMEVDQGALGGLSVEASD